MFRWHNIHSNIRIRKVVLYLVVLSSIIKLLEMVAARRYIEESARNSQLWCSFDSSISVPIFVKFPLETVALLEFEVG